jgi:hypothetical protein
MFNDGWKISQTANTSINFLYVDLSVIKPDEYINFLITNSQINELPLQQAYKRAVCVGPIDYNSVNVSKKPWDIFSQRNDDIRQNNRSMST